MTITDLLYTKNGSLSVDYHTAREVLITYEDNNVTTSIRLTEYQAAWLSKALADPPDDE